jgi:hypothetical protein
MQIKSESSVLQGLTIKVKQARTKKNLFCELEVLMKIECVEVRLTKEEVIAWTR